jgi:hypothetical protein
MLKNLDLYVYHGSKPAYSYPILIIWRIGKFLYLWTDVDETYCIASYGQNKIVYGKNSYFQCSSWQQTCILRSHVNHIEER